VTPDVTPIQLTRVKAHLVLETELSLIDCGYAGQAPLIEKAIGSLGRSIGELRRVVVTHGHPDHAGSASELAAQGIPILIHAADATRLRTTWRDVARRPSRGRVFSAMTPEIPAAGIVEIEDGQVLPMLGGLRVVHTPGHTPGSVCLYGERDGVLFVGDVLQRRFGRVGFASTLYSDDYALAKRSVKRLAELDVETLVFSHFPALEGGASKVLAELARQAG
jgi:glyoxylase-like metal-dependent hydrolase (beta-lactamase superfamily II)